ncbi:MAG: family 43 glycosylhydrolase [Clostridia bacterium]|nr:family 43 glycosylhydrolase [Clostridia bacterium]
MTDTVCSLIERDDRETLQRWVLQGKIAAVPEAETAAWARLAAERGNAAMLSWLCSHCHGMSFAADERGRTLLHYAAQSGDTETMRFAVQTLGYDAAQGDQKGITPLDLAKQQGKDALRALEELSGIRLKDCYRNPVIRGFRPDPSILRRGEDYWLINSTFVMTPALPVSHSRDLVHWETVGHVFTDPDTAGLTGLPGGFGYWAPDISFYQERFWVVATLRRNTPPYRVQMITSAPSPQGPWEAPRFLPVDGIDPSLFTDEDGKRYLVVNPGVRLARVSDAGELMEEPRLIYQGFNRRKSEGPHLLKKDGWYYIFQAEGGTGNGHMITCARSRALDGPYEACPFNPILGKKQEDAYIGRGGHGKPVQLPDGRWAIVYLCNRRVEDKSLMGRETAVDPLEWTADGWPMVNRLKGPSCLQKKFLPDAPMAPNEPWVCPRLSPESFSSLEADGSIRLQGGAKLRDLADAHALLHRLREAHVVLEATVDVRQMEAGCAAGLTGYYDEHSYFLLGLRKTAQGADVVLTQYVGDKETEETLGRVPGWQSRLRIEGRGLTFTVSCPEAEAGRQFRAEYLTDEGLKWGKRFTGALAGFAAVGTGQAIFRNLREEMNDGQD